MKKLAVIFPGVGYTCTRPLLYYTAAMAAEHNYEIIRLDYGQDIHTFRGRTPSELEPVIKLAAIILMLRLAAAAAEPLCDKRISSMISDIISPVTTVFSMVIASAMLFIISIAIIMGAT